MAKDPITSAFPNPSEALALLEPRYTPALRMLSESAGTPGYHTNIPDGRTVHSTRTAMGYAVALLMHGSPDDTRRASQVISAVLDLQETCPTEPTYGIWPWFAEEPLPQMSPPDWNWADFIGIRLALILLRCADRLDPKLIARMRAALGHAARAIFRRNVGPGYTNISIMGGGVCVLAGEVLDEPWLVDYGRQRLGDQVEHVKRVGGFNEFNSPTYTAHVVLIELERIIHLARDTQAKDHAEWLLRHTWEVIAGHFHVPTRQWAGPSQRMYSDHLRQSLVSLLNQRTGADLVPHPTIEPADGRPDLHLLLSTDTALPPLPCPDDLKPRFVEPILEPRTLITRHGNGLCLSQSPTVMATTWLGPRACLGSADPGIFWTQCRPILAYIRTNEDPAVVMRVRVQRDGRDFASFGCRTLQDGPRVLLAAYPIIGLGDHHVSLDRPATPGRFKGDELSLCVELRGEGVYGKATGNGPFILSAGDQRIAVHAPVCRFGQMQVTGQLETAPGRAAVRFILCRPDDGVIDLASLCPAVMPLGIELLDEDAMPSDSPIAFTLADAQASITWPAVGDATLTLPAGALIHTP